MRENLVNDNKTLFLEALATCHSITYVNNELIGDPLDVKMFQSTGWILEEQSEEPADDLVLAYVRHPNSTVEKLRRADSLLDLSNFSDESIPGFQSSINY